MTLTSNGLDDIRALIDEVAAGVTARDPDRCVARFSADAISVLGDGTRTRGREAIREAHVQAFAAGGPPATARFVILDAVLPRPDLAVVTTGAYGVGPGGEVDLDQPTQVLGWTLVHEPDGWWVVSRQFTPATSTATPGRQA